MKREELLERQNAMLHCLASLPKRMLSLHGMANMTEFVLYDLCHEQCFNLTKAAYFIDNPDFNCTQGIAGFSRDDIPGECRTIWDQPEAFTACMVRSAFNNKVRALSRCSIKKGGEVHEDLAAQLAHELGFNNHAYCSWQMKHENEGLVVYEKALSEDDFAHTYVENGLALLSFCPIF